MSSAAPTCVFLHGSGDDAHVWDRVIARLPGYTTVALDLPGHGALVDQPSPAEMSVGDYAAFVRDELMRRNLDVACLVGNSLGSAIALRLAVDSPELVGRLVLVGAGARLRVLPSLLAEAESSSTAAKEQLAEAGFAPGHQAEAHAFVAERAPIAPGILYRDLAACDTFDIMAELDRITQPTLILTGAEDRLTPPKYASFLAAQIANAQIEIIPNAGHYAHVEAGEAIAGAMRRWLE